MAIARTYHVKPGDTLGSIAAKFHVSKARLRAVNGLGTPAGLKAGQLLKIPVPEALPSPT